MDHGVDSADGDGGTWLADAARSLGVEPLDEREVAALLDMARDVAHGTERRHAPLTCFLVGVAAAGGRDAVAELCRRLGDEAAGR